MGYFGIGEVPFGLEDAKIAVNNLNGTWGTAVDIPSVRILRIRLETYNGVGEGDDIETVAHSKPKGATITVEMLGISSAVLEKITGLTKASSGSAPNRKFSLRFNKYNAPYLGLCGRADSAEGGDAHFFVPKMKLMEGFEVTAQFNTFSIPSLNFKALVDPSWGNDIFDLITNEAVTSVVIPPALAA